MLKATKKDLFGFSVVFVLGVQCGLAIMPIVGNTFRDGNIAAIRGEVQYHLVEQADGEMRWEYNPDWDSPRRRFQESEAR